jgi:hypothetical protein
MMEVVISLAWALQGWDIAGCRILSPRVYLVTGSEFKEYN